MKVMWPGIQTSDSWICSQMGYWMHYGAKLQYLQTEQPKTWVLPCAYEHSGSQYHLSCMVWSQTPVWKVAVDSFALCFQTLTPENIGKHMLKTPELCNHLLKASYKYLWTFLFFFSLFLKTMSMSKDMSQTTTFYHFLCLSISMYGRNI